MDDYPIFSEFEVLDTPLGVHSGTGMGLQWFDGMDDAAPEPSWVILLT